MPDTVNPVIVVVKAITINKMKSAYSLQEFRNKEGNTIVSYQDGKFHGKENKEIVEREAIKILTKSNKKGDLSSLIQHNNEE